MGDLLLPVNKGLFIQGQARTKFNGTFRTTRALRSVTGDTVIDNLKIFGSQLEELTDKGQFWVYDDAGQISAFDAGTNGQILVADDAEEKGLRWADLFLPALNTGIITNAEASTLTAGDEFVVIQSSFSQVQSLLECPGISFTASANANLSFDLPTSFPVPFGEQRYLVVCQTDTTDAATMVDGLMIIKATSPNVIITPNRAHDTLTPTFVSGNTSAVLPFSATYFFSSPV